MTPLRIALLGAESSGKSTLSQALADALAARGLAVRLVPEWLRTWCLQAGRTPRPDEQMGIARHHAGLLDQAAAALDGPAVLIADTTPLMVAVYSDLLFGDPSLYDFALQHQRRYHATLLMGLDLPWVADGALRDGPHVQAPVDAKVRAALQRAGIPFQVVYGHGPARLARAERALHGLAGPVPRPDDAPPPPSGDGPAWACDCGSDAGCEHRLFQRLLGGAA
ncbi:AAA family ATPase [Pseudorhodoferax sp.]|uniref:AAA family ATPase n=1 Tax=Pseudorhodoferax sp. TaxID=1993553 RepID=UPI0039E53910